MPTDDVTRHIAEVVDALRQAHPRPVVVRDGQRRRQSLEDYVLQILQPFLRTQFPDIPPIVCDTLGLMAYLGPLGVTWPPPSLRDECLNSVHIHTGGLSGDDETKRLIQVVLAYGCQWQRTAHSDDPQWDTHWPGAVQELVEIADNFVVEALKTLDSTVREYTRPDQYERRELAEHIASIFISTQPALGKARYEQSQSIRTWNPQRGNLYGWLQAAVQGRHGRQRRFQANWFGNSLLYALLKNQEPYQGGLDKGSVAFKHCLNCGNEAEYDDTSCANCDNPYTPAAVYLFAKELLVVPSVYQWRIFRHCTNHVYDWQEIPSCPSCGTPRTKEPGWKCECGKQHKWIQITVCPRCNDTRPERITWECPNHSYEYDLPHCPLCSQELSERPTYWLVRRELALTMAFSTEHQRALKALEKEMGQ